MASRKQLKVTRKNRRKSSAGKRSRSKRKKTVQERRRLSLLGRKKVALHSFPDITILE